MNWLRLVVMGFTCASAGLLGGCHATPPQAPGAPEAPEASVEAPADIVAAGEYDAVIDAAVQALRDLRFTVDRKDRRFGVVTTEPLIASSVVEPWYQDNTAAWQTLESTLHKQRRTVRIELKPTTEPTPEAPAGAYQLQVVAEVERQYHPPRPIHTSALGRVTYRRAERRYRPVETEAGVEESYWMSLGRDELLERRLAAMILQRATSEVATAAR